MPYMTLVPSGMFILENKMKLILIPILSMSLSGCLYQTVNKNDLDTAIKACGGLENVSEVTSSWIGNETVICTNRREIYLNEKVWDQK